MSSFRIRPVFQQTVDFSLSEAQARIVQEVEAGDGKFEIKNFPGFLCLRICPEDRHFWSPRLNLSLEETPEGKTRIDGTYGPNANVWSLFFYGYLILGMHGIFSGLFGFCQWMVDQAAWGLWIFAGVLVLAGGLYVVAQFGQKLGARQMFLIHQAYESAVGRMVEIR